MRWQGVGVVFGAGLWAVVRLGAVGSLPNFLLVKLCVDRCVDCDLGWRGDFAVESRLGSLDLMDSLLY